MYQFFMLVLCMYTLVVLVTRLVAKLNPQVIGVLEIVDYGICALFLFDFVVSVALAPNRLLYLVSWGWLDLLSSIPVIDIVRWGRIARVVRIFRVLRGLRATRVLVGITIRRRAENTFLAVSLVAILLLVFCSLAILEFESSAVESNIKTPEDALWWGVATVTTVGYGDRYPVTPEGRIVAVVLMCSGVGLFGTFSGFLAAWLLSSEQNSQQSEIEGLRADVQSIRELLEGKTQTNDR